MSKNKFSIITINLNNASGLSKTIDSVNRIKNEHIEFIVIDGNSVDDSSVLLQNKIIDKYIVENDEVSLYNFFNLYRVSEEMLIIYGAPSSMNCLKICFAASVIATFVNESGVGIKS